MQGTGLALRPGSCCVVRLWHVMRKLEKRKPYARFHSYPPSYGIERLDFERLGLLHSPKKEYYCRKNSSAEFLLSFLTCRHPPSFPFSPLMLSPFPLPSIALWTARQFSLLSLTSCRSLPTSFSILSSASYFFYHISLMLILPVPSLIEITYFLQFSVPHFSAFSNYTTVSIFPCFLFLPLPSTINPVMLRLIPHPGIVPSSPHSSRSIYGKLYRSCGDRVERGDGDSKA